MEGVVSVRERCVCEVWHEGVKGIAGVCGKCRVMGEVWEVCMCGRCGCVEV